tara:strand:+ start:523 stop:1062 length:540 start_codon:yes stop_codon:yes gene_type:complete
MLNEFEAPIPGQSLAGQELGNYPWESPPDFASPDDAFAFFFNRVMEDEEMLTDISKLLELGTAPQAITEGILFHSFSIGQITPDVTILLREPLTDLIRLVGQETGVAVQEESVESQRLEEELSERIFAEFQQERMDNLQNGAPETEPLMEETMPDEVPPPALGLMAAPQPDIEENVDGE